MKLFAQEPQTPREQLPITASARSLIAVVIAVGILCRLAFIFFTPIFYAPDEHSHFNYIKYVSEKHSFPVLTSKTGDQSNEWEYYQPPLYYLAMAPVYKAMQTAFHDDRTTVFVLRVFSLLLWLLNVWFGIGLLKRLQIKDEFLRVSTLSIICLLPTYTFLSAAINNDNLLATLSGAVVYMLARPQRTLKSSLALGILIGFALLAKLSAIVFLPAAALLEISDYLTGRINRPALLSRVGTTIVAAALVYSPWALRNWHVYGMLTPEQLPTAPIAWPSVLYGIASATHNVAKTFWAVSGISNNVGYPFPIFGMLFLGLSVAGLVKGLKGDQKPGRLTAGINASIFAAFILAILLNLVLVLRFGYKFGMGQGRHLSPSLYPIALVLSAGLWTFPLKKFPSRVAGFWILYAVSFVIFSLCRFP
jgi:hypothetical protein